MGKDILKIFLLMVLLLFCLGLIYSLAYSFNMSLIIPWISIFFKYY